jgi:hypothetical protein
MQYSRSNGSSAANIPSIAIAFVVAFVGVSLGAEWCAHHRWQFVFKMASGALAIGGIWHFGRSELTWHRRWSERYRAWSVVVMATLVAMSLGTLAAMALGEWPRPQSFAPLSKSPQHWLLVKLPTVLVQQIALQLFIVPSLTLGLGKSARATVIGASIFAALHLPNPLLVGLTWVAGFVWIKLYLRYRQLGPLVVSHFCLAVAAASLGGEYILNMRVGLKCVSLFPRSMQTASGRIKILPNAILGRVEELTQLNDVLFVRGIAQDQWHESEISEFCLIDEQRAALIRIAPESIRAVARDGKASGFELRIPVRAVRGGTNWEVYAANARGWFSKLGGDGPIAGLESAPTNDLVQLLPRKFDGRYESFGPLTEGGKLAGWAIDKVSFQVPSHMGICCGQSNWVVPVTNSLPRHDISTALGSEQSLKCGFEVVIPQLEPSQMARVALFAIDDRQVWHPLPSIARPHDNVAELLPPIQLQSNR